jgi:hypothetical protein
MSLIHGIWQTFINIINYTEKINKRPMTIEQCACILGHQVISNALSCSKTLAAFRTEQDKGDIIPPTCVSDSFLLGLSSLSDDCIGSQCHLIPVHSLSDCQGVVHHQVKLQNDTQSSDLVNNAKDKAIKDTLCFTVTLAGCQLGFAVPLQSNIRLF